MPGRFEKLPAEVDATKLMMRSETQPHKQVERCRVVVGPGNGEHVDGAPHRILGFEE
jgi:hypothetical protein